MLTKLSAQHLMSYKLSVDRYHLNDPVYNNTLEKADTVEDRVLWVLCLFYLLTSFWWKSVCLLIITYFLTIGPSIQAPQWKRRNRVTWWWPR